MKNSCALITGAGEGLGRSFALHCAALGYDLILISLPGSRLDKLSDLIEGHYGVRVWSLEENLCETENMDHVIDFINNHQSPIKLLINNAGLGHTKRFDELSGTYLNLHLTLNIQVLTQLIHCIIPLMRDSGGGQIINIGSMAGFYALPLKNTYAASKAYVFALSRALHIEFAPFGVGVSVVCPNGINSNVKQYMVFRQSGWLARSCFLDPDSVAAYAMEKSMKGHTVIIPGKLNRAIWMLTSLIPAFLKRFLARTYIKPLPTTFKPTLTKLPKAA